MTNRSVERYDRVAADPADAIDVRSVLVDGAPARPAARDDDGLDGLDGVGARGSPIRRRMLLALAGTGLVGGPLLAKQLLGDSPGASPPETRDAAYRAADAGGFANRDESYASTGREARAAEPMGVFATPNEAAQATEVTVPTILATDDPALHLLRRVTFGPTPTQVDEIHDQGIDAWLAQQLDPAAIPDEPGDAAWGLFPLASMEPSEIQRSIERYSWNAMGDYGRATLARQIWSRRQVFEVVVDFWADHLHVPMPGAGGWDVGASYHNDVIRRHALGSFTDMLLAAMQHPAMLRFLSNAESKKDAVNENLGRELLELHTVGVASGYTEDDVRNSAYILTGRIAENDEDAPNEGSFVYDADRHWTGPVQVLDFQHPNPTAEGGLEVGDAYLRYLATHPSTARTIAHKLAVRFVADSPPDALVERLATTFLDSGTEILPVLDILFRSGEFWAAVGQKTRRPLENVVASARALDVRPGGDTVNAVKGFYWQVEKAGHAPLAWRAPNGYPDVQPAWRSAGGILEAWNTHRSMVEGWHEGATYGEPADLITGRPQATVGEYVDSLCQRLCFQTFQPQHRDALIAFAEADPTAPTAQSRLGDQVQFVIPLVLDSPYFALR
jgi:uncharacterized protein (DUF1800 family)